MSADLLAKLRPLQHQRGDVSPFVSNIEYLQWADKVAGLLSYNEKLNYRFRHYVSHAKSKIALNDDPTYGVNESIGVMNEAISSLENKRNEPSSTKQTPQFDKLTLKWLYEFAPWPFYIWLFGICAVFFSFGFAASEMKTAIYSKPLSEAAPTTTKPTIANPTIAQPAIPKSIASTPK